MNSPAFQRVASFTDLHLGNKNNSQEFHQDCHDYLTWFIEQAKEFEAETCVFMGDFFHKRSAINVMTLNVALEILERLSKAFRVVYVLVGNHDMYFRNNRLVNAIEIARNLDNVVLVRDLLNVGDMTLVPYLVEDEWKEIKDLKSRYVFGHFELPGFLMNAMIEAPDHGLINASHFVHQEYVFSGHFHQRQQAGKIHYIGNAFPHNFSDAWDDARGCLLLEHGGTPQLLNWDKCPKYRTFTLTDFIKSNITIPDKSYLRVTVDTETSYEETEFLRQSMIQQGARTVELQTPGQLQSDDQPMEEISFEPVDQIVIKNLEKFKSETLSQAYLIEIYQAL